MKGLKKALKISMILGLISIVFVSIIGYISMNVIGIFGSSENFLSFDGVLFVIGGFFLSTFLWFVLIVVLMWVKEEWE